jgi:hypothetical protein
VSSKTRRRWAGWPDPTRSHPSDGDPVPAGSPVSFATPARAVALITLGYSPVTRPYRDRGGAPLWTPPPIGEFPESVHIESCTRIRDTDSAFLIVFPRFSARNFRSFARDEFNVRPTAPPGSARAGTAPTTAIRSRSVPVPRRSRSRRGTGTPSGSWWDDRAPVGRLAGCPRRRLRHGPGRESPGQRPECGGFPPREVLPGPRGCVFVRCIKCVAAAPKRYGPIYRPSDHYRRRHNSRSRRHRVGCAGR